MSFFLLFLSSFWRQPLYSKLTGCSLGLCIPVNLGHEEYLFLNLLPHLDRAQPLLAFLIKGMQELKFLRHCMFETVFCLLRSWLIIWVWKDGNIPSVFEGMVPTSSSFMYCCWEVILITTSTNVTHFVAMQGSLSVFWAPSFMLEIIPATV